MTMEKQTFDYGMIGLGTMGRNLVYNMCDHQYAVAGYDKDMAMVDTLEREKNNSNLFGARTIKELMDALKNPRTILLLVPAGSIVDAVIEELVPLLSKDDLIIDCGNSHFTDTDRRMIKLAKENINFMGIGISGGEYGARNGPSIMPGGHKEIYDRVAPMLQAIAAKADGEPCVTYLGNGSAGHYVKMVHNGIEYALMELIAETYQLLKQGLGLKNAELSEVYSKWNEGPLHSFLISITAEIFKKKDDLTDNDLVDMILDSAHQKGTGAWTTEDAMALQVPIPVIDIAVSMRNISIFKEERLLADKQLNGPNREINFNKDELIALLQDALRFSIITVFAQGMELLQKASEVYKYGFNLKDIAAIWRGGCIIRASILEDICVAFEKQPSLSNLMLSDVFKEQLVDLQKKLRQVACLGINAGIPLPAFLAALAYFDSYRSSWLPGNLLQAQRDYFGAHTYERIDREGIFHTQWNQKEG